jgi:hypothetical protein
MDHKIADSFNYRQIRPVNKRFLDRARNKRHGFDLVGKRAKYGVSQIRSHIRVGLWRSVKELLVGQASRLSMNDGQDARPTYA